MKDNSAGSTESQEQNSTNNHDNGDQDSGESLVSENTASIQEEPSINTINDQDGEMMNAKVVLVQEVPLSNELQLDSEPTIGTGKARGTPMEVEFNDFQDGELPVAKLINDATNSDEELADVVANNNIPIAERVEIDGVNLNDKVTTVQEDNSINNGNGQDDFMVRREIELTRYFNSEDDNSISFEKPSDSQSTLISEKLNSIRNINHKDKDTTSLNKSSQTQKSSTSSQKDKNSIKGINEKDKETIRLNRDANRMLDQIEATNVNNDNDHPSLISEFSRPINYARELKSKSKKPSNNKEKDNKNNKKGPKR